MPSKAELMLSLRYAMCRGHCRSHASLILFYEAAISPDTLRHQQLQFRILLPRFRRPFIYIGKQFMRFLKCL